ncbi:MAG: hypothetical protein HY657_01360 [Acidobacteria bacterium]|nr:hypothetical protein [Acidobacteriota bacterium]
MTAQPTDTRIPIRQLPLDLPAAASHLEGATREAMVQFLARLLAGGCNRAEHREERAETR